MSNRVCYGYGRFLWSRRASISSVMHVVVTVVATGCFLVLLCVLIVALIHRTIRPKKPRTLGFFHPFCSSGGGGERVLWKMIESLECFEYDIVIYTVDAPSEYYVKELLQHVQERFSLTISPHRISLVHLHESVDWLRPVGSFTLLRESLGAMVLGYRALCHVTPSVFVDTTGCAFTFLPARLLFGCRIVAYVHYPTISTDMLQLVWERRRSAYNHADFISSSSIMTYIKLLYYLVFAGLYGFMGSFAEVVMVNSTWTFRHIRSLWMLSPKVQIVYPPCSLDMVIDVNKVREPMVLSIGQFRPEKDHVLQIEAMELVAKRIPNVKLILAGSCRNQSDHDRLAFLKSMAGPNVEFCVNQPHSVIADYMSRAMVGIHTMWNEHFGIGIVEMMAAGLIVVAHNSGGPKADIIEPGHTGFLASTVEEYASQICQVLKMSTKERQKIERKAIDSSKRFGDASFSDSIQKVFLTMKI